MAANHVFTSFRVLLVISGVVMELLSMADVAHIADILFPFFMVKVVFEWCLYSGDYFLKQLLRLIVLG